MVLGESVRNALHYHVERANQVKREEIPNRMEEFHEALGSLLGAGARVVEKLIAKNLYSRLGLAYEERENWTLMDYLNQARKATR